MPVPPAGMMPPPPAMPAQPASVAPAPAAPKPVLKPRVAAPKPVAAGAPPPKAAIPRPAAAPAPRPTAVRPVGAAAEKAKDGKEGEAAATDPAPAAEEESPNVSAIAAVIDVLALAAGVAGAVLFYLDYTAAAVLF